MDITKLILHDNEYKRFLIGKKIAIIGPSESAFFNKSGDYIDSCDVVVRINRGIELIPGNEMFIGSKTNVLYNSLDMDIRSGGRLGGVTNNIKFICCPYAPYENTWTPPIFEGNPTIFDKYNVRFINKEIYNQYKARTISRISTGFGSIIDLIQHDFETLFITGLDFYRSFYNKKYNPERGWEETIKGIENGLEWKVYNDDRHHHPDRQYKSFKEILKNDSRITLDPFLTKITKDPRYDDWDTIPRNEVKLDG